MSSDDPKSGGPQTVQFHYIKGSYFRVVLADGAIGNVTPQGKILFSLYNERAALPRLIVQEVNEKGVLGQVVSSESKTGIVREMEVAVVMDRNNAVGLRDWLTTTIGELDKIAQNLPGDEK